MITSDYQKSTDLSISVGELMETDTIMIKLFRNEVILLDKTITVFSASKILT